MVNNQCQPLTGFSKFISENYVGLYQTIIPATLLDMLGHCLPIKLMATIVAEGTSDSAAPSQRAGKKEDER